MWDLLWTFSYFPSLTKHKTKQTNKTTNNKKKQKPKIHQKQNQKPFKFWLHWTAISIWLKLSLHFFFMWIIHDLFDLSVHIHPPISISGIIFCDLTWKNIGIYRSLKLQSFLLHNIHILTSKKPDFFWTVTALKRHYRPYGFTLLKKEFVR